MRFRFFRVNTSEQNVRLCHCPFNQLRNTQTALYSCRECVSSYCSVCLSTSDIVSMMSSLAVLFLEIHLPSTSWPPLCCGDKSRETVASIAPRLPAPVCTGVRSFRPPCRLRERQTQGFSPVLWITWPLLLVGQTEGTWEDRNFHSFLCPMWMVPMLWQNPWPGASLLSF